VVTLKDYEADVRSGLGVAKVSHYGATRGSNAYRDCDAVVLLGSYRLPPDVGRLIELVHGEIDLVDLALAAWHQELFRARMRLLAPNSQKGGGSSGAKINVLFAGEKAVRERFRDLVKSRGCRNVYPIVSVTSPRRYLEFNARREMDKAQSFIMETLLRKHRLELRDLARRFRGRDVGKARNTWNKFVRKFPGLEGLYTVTDDVVELVDRSDTEAAARRILAGSRARA
jgi:hypothetical protein